MFGKTVYGTAFQDVNFVPLQSAAFCVQCELISNNSRPYCLACGSHALLGLSRVLGGSMRNQQTAHLITDIELNDLVRDLLRTVPEAEVFGVTDHIRMPSLALRSQLRVANAAHPVSGFRAVSLSDEAEIHPAELHLEPAISAITERAGIGRAPPERPSLCEPGMKSCAGPAPVELLLTSGFVCKPTPASPPKRCAPARLCFVTTPSVTHAWTWPVAAVSESARFWYRPCVTTAAPWAFSKCCPRPLGPSTSAMWLPCSCFRA